MILATHPPLFLPWPGFFAKAMEADGLVLLDDIQYPRGGTWLNRNRLKSHQGELWLSVPVWKKGRGLQSLREVEIYEERGWRQKHLRSLRQSYSHAPYFEDHFGGVERIYHQGHARLLDHNLALIHLLWGEISPRARLLRQSELGVGGKGTELLIRLCERLGADRYAVFPGVRKHLDVAGLGERGIELVPLGYRPFVYPQLWGDFRYNLSTLDLLFNCGPKSRELIARAGEHHERDASPHG